MFPDKSSIALGSLATDPVIFYADLLKHAKGKRPTIVCVDARAEKLPDVENWIADLGEIRKHSKTNYVPHIVAIFSNGTNADASVTMASTQTHCIETSDKQTEPVEIYLNTLKEIARQLREEGENPIRSTLLTTGPMGKAIDAIPLDKQDAFRRRLKEISDDKQEGRGF